MDKDILTTLAHFQEKIQEISIAFNELRDITYDLYKENEALKEENKDLQKILFNKNENSKEGEGYSNLMYLYNEGFHICHLSFGEKRSRECLFCIQVVEKNFAENK